MDFEEAKYRIVFVTAKYPDSYSLTFDVLAYGSKSKPTGWYTSAFVIRFTVKCGNLSSVAAEDYLSTPEFIEFDKTLCAIRDEGMGQCRISGWDMNEEIEVCSETSTADVVFTGRIPAFDYSDRGDYEQLLREGLRTLFFEFATDRSTLTEPIAAIERLFADVEQLDSGWKEDDRRRR